MYYISGKMFVVGNFSFISDIANINFNAFKALFIQKIFGGKISGISDKFNK